MLVLAELERCDLALVDDLGEHALLRPALREHRGDEDVEKAEHAARGASSSYVSGYSPHTGWCRPAVALNGTRSSDARAMNRPTSRAEGNASAVAPPVRIFAHAPAVRDLLQHAARIVEQWQLDEDAKLAGERADRTSDRARRRRR